MDPVFDCTDLPPSRLRRRFLSRLADLERGRGFLLRSPARCDDLLRLMEETHPGLFEWHVLFNEPGDHAVLVVRPRGGARQAPGLVALLFNDHHQIHDLAARLGRAAALGQMGRLVVLARQLEKLLTEHFRREEELVFPALTRQLGSHSRVVERLRGDHQQGLELVRLISRTLAAAHASAEDLKRRAIALQSLLHTHSHFEDGLFYLLAEVLLDPRDQEELLNRCLERELAS